MIEEAQLVEENGLVPQGEGWFVVNSAQSRWFGNETFGFATSFEGKARFEQIGVNIQVLQPGQPACLYHAETDQENFLVLAGECTLLVEEQERQLKAWDFFHCPPGTHHVFVGAGDGPCAILMIGARNPEGSVNYPVSDLAKAHGAGVESATDQPSEAYAPFPKFAPVEQRWAGGLL